MSYKQILLAASALALPISSLPAAMVLQAEDYKAGLNGTAYSDADASNNGGQYRVGTNEEVDIEATTDGGDGFNVGWTAAGEWFEFAADPGTWTTDPTFDSTSLYTVTFRIAANNTDPVQLRLSVGGVDVTGDVTFTGGSGWQAFQDVTVTTTSEIAAGTQPVRLDFVTANINVNYVSLEAIPEPSTSLLALTAGLGLLARRRR